jgi:hypothetical protein
MARERFDLVIVGVYVGNDIVDRPRRYFPRAHREPSSLADIRWPRSLDRRAFYWSVVYPVVSAGRRHSQLLELAWSTTELARIRLGVTGMSIPWVFRQDRATGGEGDTTTSILAEIAGVAEQRGLTVLDALPRLRVAQLAGQEPFGVVDRHLSAAGHRALLDIVGPVADTLFARRGTQRPNQRRD